MPTVGAGAAAAAAYAPGLADVKGVRIAFLGFSQITELASKLGRHRSTGLGLAIADAQDRPGRSRPCATAKSQADVVVVYMHWGQEYDECPIALQKTLAAKPCRGRRRTDRRHARRT